MYKLAKCSTAVKKHCRISLDGAPCRRGTNKHYLKAKKSAAQNVFKINRALGSWKIFSSIFLLIFNLYKLLQIQLYSSMGCCLNHLNVANIRLYHSRLSLAREVQRGDKEIIWCFNIQLHCYHDQKKIQQWVGRHLVMIHKYHRTSQMSFDGMQDHPGRYCEKGLVLHTG